MSWKKVRLGDISNSIQTGPFGSQLHKSDYSVEGIPVVMPKDIVDGKLSDESIARVNESHVNRLKRHKIEVGDILYSRRGDVGRCALATKNEEGWLCGTGCLRVTINTDIANPKFIFYQLQKKEIIGWVEKHAVGATMLNLNTSILSDVPIELPNINEQNRIVEKISAYDDLIENNKKQIKLLEEAAERLYREWFVNLHFPGCEEVKIVDGVPKGWLDGTVGDIALFKRGKTITKAQIHKGIVPVVAGGLEPAYYHNVANTVAPVITISGSGANAGFARLYNFIKDSKAKLDSLQKGAAQPHVYAKDINALKIYIPTDDILDRFCKVVAPYFGKIKNLQRQNDLLLQARDRLLPRLMSGEVEV